MLTTEGLRDRVNQCGVPKDFDHGSDHYPVALELDVSIANEVPEASYDLRRMDRAAFINELSKLPSRLSDINTANEQSLNLHQPNPQSLHTGERL